MDTRCPAVINDSTHTLAALDLRKVSYSVSFLFSSEFSIASP
jgi:hypothetical protein